MQTIFQDLRYAFRMLTKSPAFTTVAILTLALGIGANTAIFSLIDAVMLRSLPVESPTHLVVLKWSAHKQPKIHGYMSSGDCSSDMRFGAPNPSGCSFSQPMFRTLEKANAFSGLAAFSNSGRLDLKADGPAAVVNGQIVSGDFFRTLGVKPAAGRLIQPIDDSPTAPAVAVLNYGYWQSAFGGSHDVIGRSVQLNGVPVQIIGVAEQRFTGLTPGSDYDLWLPLSVAPSLTNPTRWGNRQDDSTFWWLTLVARLKPDMPTQQAQAAINVAFSNEVLHGAVPVFDAGATAAPYGPGPAGGMMRRETQGGGPPPPGPAPRMAIPIPAPNAAQKSAPNVAIGAARPQNRQPSIPIGTGPDEPAAADAASSPADQPVVVLVPARVALNGSSTRYANPLYVLMLAVGIILLIACANVAGLTLARSSARRKEMAVRLALGAGRARIIRQLLIESVTLSCIGGALGIFFAYWGARLIVSFVASNQARPLGFAAGVDLRVLAFTAVISLTTGILFGLAPALRGARVDLTPALKDGFGTTQSVFRGEGRWFSVGNALVVAQVALAIVVLVGAGLLVRTLKNLRSIDVGFDSHNLVIFTLDPTRAGYKDAQVDDLYRDLLGRFQQIPGVKSASFSSLPLLSGGLMMISFHWPGTPEDRDSESNMLTVGPDFFTTMQIPFLSGRSFVPSDYVIASANNYPASSDVPTSAIVNQAFVSKFVGQESPIGKRFGASPASDEGPKSSGFEIVGVVRDAKYSNLREDVSPTIYSPQSGSGASFELRTAADPQSLLPAIRRTVADVNANLPLFDVSTESQQIDRLLFQERLVARLATFFGVLALLLASIGLYGLLSYEVARRTREIGIRMALGARMNDVLRLVVKQGLTMAFLGALVGVGAALGVTRYLKSMLFHVRTNDPITIIAVAALLALVALAACYIPARRATRVDPIVALRYE
jgi:predicted permease